MPFTLDIWGWVGGLSTVGGNLDELTAPFDELTRSRVFPQVWKNPGLPLLGHLDRIQNTHLHLSFPSVSRPVSSIVFVGRCDDFCCFGSTDSPFYSTDDELRIKTTGSPNPTTSFYR